MDLSDESQVVLLSDESQVVLLSDLQPKELAKDRVSEKKEEEEEEVALECSSLVVTSSDTDNEEQAQIEEETDEDAALEQVISQQLRSSPQDTFLDDKMLRFYSAINQFRLVAASADGTNLAATKARAIAMSILEMFVLPKAKLKVDLSPPLRKGLMVVHSKLQAFYQGAAYRSRPPRLAADLFERAAKEIRGQVRNRVEDMFAEKAKQSAEFKAVASSDASPESFSTEKFMQQEILLIGAKRLLDNASLRGKSESLRSNAGTIRFEVPHPKKQEEVAVEVDSAISDWLGGGRTTLRKVISLAGQQSKEKKSVEELKIIARIENRVAEWQGPHARIAEQVDQWSAKEANDKKKNWSTRGKTEEKKKQSNRKWKKTM